jgi:hypothetical protein
MNKIEKRNLTLWVYDGCHHEKKFPGEFDSAHPEKPIGNVTIYNVVIDQDFDYRFHDFLGKIQKLAEETLY